MTDEKEYEIFNIINKKLIPTAKYITLYDFKKKFKNYYYNKESLHNPNILEIIGYDANIDMQVYIKVG